MSLLLVDIPDETLRLIASFLTAKDVLQFLSSNRHLALTLGHSESFWRLLLGNDNDNDTPVVKEPFFDYEDAKVSYLTKAYTQALPSVAWKPCFASRQSPSSREGHFACKLGPYAVFTGGFTNDEHVYLLDTRDFTEEEEDWQKLEPTAVECWRHPNNNNNNNNAPSSMRAPENVNPLVETNPEHSPARVYGASLTALDDHRAVRFGGFRGGGYTGETGEVALLTVQGQDEEEEENKKAVWQVIQTHNEGMPVGLPRAYHTATLISNRYLLILGGMISSGCIRGEAVLDTKTWTWLTDVPITQEMKQPKPSGRHGHSVVLDEKRNRLVLFGGGSGTDLLRSGSDNAEVWQLTMGPGWNSEDLQEFQNSLPWEWELIRDDEDEDSSSSDDDEEDVEDIDSTWPSLQSSDKDNNDHATKPESLQDIDGESNDYEEEDSLPPLRPARRTWQTSNNDKNIGQTKGRDPNRLTDTEKLCLGRCHLGFKVGPDTALLVFGSGRPSTNGCLAFNLDKNEFFRPQLAGGGKLPTPRFTSAGVLFGDHNSYLLVQGGYSSQESAAIGDLCVLDLAPAVERDLFVLEEDDDYEAYDPVTQTDVDRYNQRGHGNPFGHGGIPEEVEDLIRMVVEGHPAGQGARRARDPGEMAAQMLGGMVMEMGGPPGDHGPVDDGDEDDDPRAFMMNMLAQGMMGQIELDDDEFQMAMAMGIFANDDDESEEADYDNSDHASESDDSIPELS